LNSLVASELPPSVAWEILVVDNNSSDQTRDVAKGFCHRYPGRFRYLFEPNPGKSYALNAGIREAKGEVLAFTDDDVTVEPIWLRNLTTALHDKEWAGVGGRTLMAHSFSPPPWLALRERNLGILCATFDLGDKPCELDIAPYGANMAFRRVMFEKYGGFRTDLGPRPGSEIRNEDTEFGRRLMSAGERLGYEPAAIVYHPVPENRVQKSFFLDWWFDYGRAAVREWQPRPDVWGIPRPYLNILKLGTVEMASRMWQWIRAVDPAERFFCKCWVWMAAGEISELYHLVRCETKTQERRAISENIKD